ncbi:MAG: cache domain-containing protein [Chloroflexota bacterium]
MKISRSETNIDRSKVDMPGRNILSGNHLHLPIATKLLLSYLPIIIVTSGVFTVVGIQIITTRILAEAQEKVRHDLNSAREIYQNRLNQINNVVQLTADRFFLTEALLNGNIASIGDELIKVKVNVHLDILSLTDATGEVIFRSSNPEAPSNPKTYDELVAKVLSQKAPVVSTSLITGSELLKESLQLYDQAHIVFVDTPRARPTTRTELTSGLMLKAAAPIFDYHNNLIGVLYGGNLLNRNYEIVDDIKQTVFEDVKYNGKDIGTATIFQDDVRIATNVKNSDGSRAIGTRVSEEVYNQVVIAGQPWIGRAYVVNDWYITAYEPIRNINYEIIGILYVGSMEQKYSDIKNHTILAFVAIALLGIIVSTLISNLISQKITTPIKLLVNASREIAQGNLNPKIEVTSHDELGELAIAFNTMSNKLIEREDKLKEFTKSKIMESEKLAIVGQLAANVAHELNNPLVGIITYSHLLLEETPASENATEFLNKIVIQANRCKDIVRGLLDFARQRKPDRTLFNINNLLKQCISLLENQVIFHNIKIILDLEEVPMVILDPSQVERVFMNIILNAAEAMDGKGELNISSRFDSDEGVVEVQVRDTGPGISEENLEQIFDPFFTTKDVGHGVGLGLAISYGIIREHNGTTTVKSKIGEGTTFTVRLPVSVHGNMRYH